MELVLLGKIEGLVLGNPTNAGASLLLTLKVPAVCLGVPPSFLTDSAVQVPGVTYPGGL